MAKKERKVRERLTQVFNDKPWDRHRDTLAAHDQSSPASSRQQTISLAVTVSHSPLRARASDISSTDVPTSDDVTASNDVITPDDVTDSHVMMSYYLISSTVKVPTACIASVHSPCPSCRLLTFSTSLQIWTRSPILNSDDVVGEVIGGVDGDAAAPPLPVGPGTWVKTAGLNVHLKHISTGTSLFYLHDLMRRTLSCHSDCLMWDNFILIKGRVLPLNGSTKRYGPVPTGVCDNNVVIFINTNDCSCNCQCLQQTPDVSKFLQSIAYICG